MTKEDVKQSYTEFHKKNRSKHLYPTEWIIRTMLGTYPQLRLDKSKYQGGKILDQGCGDGRNMSLLNNCGLDIYGVEITKEAVDLVADAMADLNIKATLKVGNNTNIPFEDGFFDYVLASSSCYYVDAGNTFQDNLNEMTRVLKPGGYLIANFPAITGVHKVASRLESLSILDNATPTDDGHVIVNNDVYGIRNGYKFKAFSDEQEIKDIFSAQYEDVSIGYLFENHYGVQVNQYILTAKKK